MPNTYITPWSKPVTEHSWFVAPPDDAKDYQLTRRYRQSIADRRFIWGTRYSPLWSKWGPPFLFAFVNTYMITRRFHRPWWLGFYYFPVLYAGVALVLRFHREFYIEYQIHKILTWGQFEISHAKRKMAGAKEHPVPISERRTVEDLDMTWRHGGHILHSGASTSA